ncbi:MAG: diphosphomevalonate decarboxylase [Saprospirales bacterium]|nr:MAG: diphosphomevalonate decarboxylase [Saprospirales bacterium]
MQNPYINPSRVINSSDFNDISVKWSSPSNIALVKYWGKYGRQFPSNPSVSFTLEKARTEMQVICTLNKDYSDNKTSVKLFFEGRRNEKFESRISSFLESVTDIFPFLRQTELQIHSKNSFPHSSGIASSASSMSALALCLCDIEKELFGEKVVENFYQKVSYVARLASGSACRSVFPIASVWGKTSAVEESSNEFGIGVGDRIHQVFTSFKDAILVLSDREKSVSSSAGHGLMEDHPFAVQRFAKAEKNMQRIIQALAKGEIEDVGQIVEEEALMLHAMMMTSNPSYILFEPATIAVINEIRSFRKDTGIQAYFTLDAGPNVHLLYPEDQATSVEDFINTNLMKYCVPGKSIFDYCGQGPRKIN